MGTAGADRARGVILGLALGDALGAPFEGRSRVDAAEVQHLVTSDEPLRFTDDTHMAATLARVLVEAGTSFDEQTLGDAFSSAYAAEPWRGYGPGPPQVFAMAARGTPYTEAAGSLFDGTGSFGNGAAMRAAPAGLAAGGDPDLAAELATRQARVTHTHPQAIDGAVFIARAVCLLARTEPAGLYDAWAEAADALPEGVIRQQLATVFDAVGSGEDLHAIARTVGTGVAARESVPAAGAAALTGRSVLETVTAAIGLGGDTDTIAAMAGAMAGATYGDHGLDRGLLDRLEDAAALARLADRLGSGSP